MDKPKCKHWRDRRPEVGLCAWYDEHATPEWAGGHAEVKPGCEKTCPHFEKGN